MKINKYLVPNSLEEAFGLLQEEKSIVIGGGAFLHLGKRNVNNAIDISKIVKESIEEGEEYIEIGALTTLETIENDSILKNYFNGLLRETVKNIMGVQIRNMATIGGAISGKYGFSDIITSLLALDAEVEFYKNGRMKLSHYLEGKWDKDILIKVLLKKNTGVSKYLNLRNTFTDFSILNVAVSKLDNNCTIVVGSRPGIAKKAITAMEYINKEGINEESARIAGEMASNSLTFGDDLRASAIYRKEICMVLVKRALLEVIK